MVADSSVLFGAKMRWFMLLPKVGRLTRSPMEVNRTCSISWRMCSSSLVTAVRPLVSAWKGYLNCILGPLYLHLSYDYVGGTLGGLIRCLAECCAVFEDCKIAVYFDPGSYYHPFCKDTWMRRIR